MKRHCSSAPYLFLAFTLAIASVAAKSDGKWELATSDTRATIRVVRNQIHVTHLTNPDARHNWAGKDMTIPLMAKVWVGARECATTWKFDRGNQDSTTGTLTLAFTNAEPALTLKSIWRARPGHGPIEHWLELENRAGQTVTVSHQDSLSLPSLRPDAPAQVWWIKRGANKPAVRGGTFTEPLAANLDLTLTNNCMDGASPVPWLVVQVGERHGLYVGWEFSGLGRINAMGRNEDALAINVGLNPDFKTDVAPGETFPIPPAFMGCYRGDIDEGSYTLHRFVIEKLRPSVPDDYPDPSLNYAIYLDAGGPTGAKTADLLRVAAFAHDLGFEAFMPDAMWFPSCGDWRWDPARFPEGIKPIADHVHRAGMKMALWCAWTHGGISEDPDALSLRGPVGHPDWFNTDFSPDWKPHAFSGGRICLACPEAREWAIKKTQWLVGHHNLDYFKHDCSPIVTACNKTTHRHRYGVDVSYWATMGYYEVQEELRQAFPRVILENCSGGGHLKDFGAIRRTHYTVTTDTLSALPDRQSIFDSTFALPPLVLQAYTYDKLWKDTPSPYFWRSAMMGAWQLAPAESAAWTDEEKNSARRAAEIYKAWIRPMLKDVKVHHILPRPDGVHWDGMFYWSPNLKRGTLYIFRPQSPDSEKVVKLKGLEPRNKYRVWCEDGSIAPSVRTGKDLMDEGLAIKLAGQFTSDLIYVEDASIAKSAETGHRADWMSKGSFGLMVHYLITPPGNTPDEKTAAFNQTLVRFDLARFRKDFLSTGADWLIFTVGQNTTYYNSPNAWLDARHPGHAARRDLVLEIAKGLKSHGKHFIAYLPAELAAPFELHNTFGWRTNEPTQKEFQRKYQEFIRSYSLQYGKHCDGWWFDGCYEWAVFPNKNMDFANYIAAARAGNPRAIVAFNDGSFCIGKVKPVTLLEDYHAGEIHTMVDGKIALGWWQNNPKPYLPDSRFVEGVQWHGLMPVDSTFCGPTLPDQHYDDRTLVELLRRVKAVGGAMTLNVPVQRRPNSRENAPANAAGGAGDTLTGYKTITALSQFAENELTPAEMDQGVSCDLRPMRQNPNTTLESRPSLRFFPSLKLSCSKHLSNLGREFLSLWPFGFHRKPLLNLQC